MIKQSFNGRIGAWVKWKYVKGTKKLKIINVKQKLPKTPFKDVPIHHKK